MINEDTSSSVNVERAAFRQDIQQMVKSMVDFALGQRQGVEGRALIELAANVRVYLDGRFQSINEIYDVCASHRWNASVYEAWAYETAQRVREQAARLGEIGAEALLMCAWLVMEVDRDSVCEAMDEAQETLYGYRTAVLI